MKNTNQMNQISKTVFLTKEEKIGSGLKVAVIFPFLHRATGKSDERFSFKLKVGRCWF